MSDWCKADDCPAAICGGPHVTHVCIEDAEVTTNARNVEPCPFCGKRPGEFTEPAVEPDSVVELDPELGDRLVAALDAGAKIRGLAIEAIRAASFEAPKAGSHSEWSKRIDMILTTYLTGALRVEEMIATMQIELADAGDWHRYDCSTTMGPPGPFPCDCPASEGWRVYLRPPP